MKKYLLGLFFLSLVVFNLNLNREFKSDTAPARLLPFNTFSGKGFYLDDYAKFFPADNTFLQSRNGHQISSYPLLPGAVAIPFYIPFFIYLKLNNLANIDNFYSISFDAERVSASFIASISVVLFFLLIKKISKNIRLSLIFTLIFAFATGTFSISSQLLWQHGLANLFLIISQLFLLRKKFTSSLVFGLLCLFTRYSFLLYCLMLLIIILLADPKKKKIYAAVTFLGLSLFFVYNQSVYGMLIGTESNPVSDTNLGNTLFAMFGFLFSPARGIFIYTPFVLFSFLSAKFIKKIKDQFKDSYYFFLLNYAFLIAVIMVHSTRPIWWAGWSWGDRYLTDGAVCIVILAYYFYIFVRRNLFLRLVMLVLVIYSVLLQAVGVFYYPRGHFDDWPNQIDHNPGRLWDFTDNPILRNLAVGPDLSGIYKFYYKLIGVKAVVYSEEERKCSITKFSESSRFGLRSIHIVFQNLSNQDWLSAGPNALNIRQIYWQAGIITQSPIPSTPLPPVIKSKQKVPLDIIVVPPGQGNFQVLISSVQEGVAWWNRSCKLVINI